MSEKPQNSPSRYPSWLRSFSGRIWTFIFIVIISLAVLVQLGRESFPFVSEYKENIAEYIGDQLHAKIRLGRLEAVWSGFRPRIELSDLHVDAVDGETIFSVGQASAELSILESIRTWKLAWRHISFQGFHLNLQQQEDGSWIVPGIKTRSSGNNNFRMDDPWDIFLFGRRLDIRDVNLALSFHEEQQATVKIPSITLENDKDFHRLEASVSLDQQSNAFWLIIEGYGDPRDRERFSSKGYLSFKQFPMERLVAAVDIPFWQSQPQGGWREGHNIDLDLWFEGSSFRGLAFQGSLAAQGIPMAPPLGFQLPSATHGSFHGRWHPEKDWLLTLLGWRFQWGDKLQYDTQLSLVARGGGGEAPSVRIPSLDLDELSAILKQMPIQHDYVRRLIHELSPSGRFENIHIALTDPDNGVLSVRANAKGIAHGAHMGAPALNGLTGYLETGLNGGYFDLVSENVSVFLPKVYPAEMVFKTAQGRMNWALSPNKQRLRLASSQLDVSGDVAASGYLRLDLPLKKGLADPEMTLLLGATDIPALSHQTYIPNTIPKDLYRWLEQGIRGGHVDRAQVLFDGSVKLSPTTSPTIQVLADASAVSLHFDPHWPLLQEAEGQLLIDDERVEVSVKRADFLGTKVSHAFVAVKDNPVGRGKGIAVTARVDSGINESMALVNASPIRDALGDTFDTWKMQGAVSTQAKVFVPLDTDSQGLSQEVDIHLNDVDLNITELDLQPKNIHGTVHYSSRRGVSAKKLTARLWGKKFTASLKEFNNVENKPALIMNFDGALSVADLQTWSLLPELSFAEGESAVSGQLTIPYDIDEENYLALTAVSDLNGVDISLPEPLLKTAEERAHFHVDIHDLKEKLHFNLTYSPLDTLSSVNALIDVYEDQETGVSVALNTAKGTLIPVEKSSVTPGVLDIVGHIQQFDIEAWLQANERYDYFVQSMNRERARRGEIVNTEPSTMTTRLGVKIDYAVIGESGIDNLMVSGSGVGDEGTLFLDSDMVRGRVFILDDSPLIFDLDHVRLITEGEADAEELSDAAESYLSDIDLGEAFEFDFAAREFSINEENYGRWKFNLRLLEKNGVVFNNLEGHVRGIHVGGQHQPAELVWVQMDGTNHTVFSGGIDAGDLGTALEQWEQEKLLTSKQSYFNLKANWQGAPDEIALDSVQGLVSFLVKDGSFIRGAEVGENPLLRLIALFNFDTLARRLRLDFSDLTKEGFAFDRIQGELKFSNGFVYLANPTVLQSSSSEVQLAGIIDLINQEIDAQVVFTLPVASNLAVATAFLAGLPAGVGVFIVSKLFKKQVDKVSSINYEVKGDWTSPKLRVRKVFNNTAARKKGKEVKQKDRDRNEVKP